MWETSSGGIYIHIYINLVVETQAIAMLETSQNMGNSQQSYFLYMLLTQEREREKFKMD